MDIEDFQMLMMPNKLIIHIFQKAIFDQRTPLAKEASFQLENWSIILIIVQKQKQIWRLKFKKSII